MAWEQVKKQRRGAPTSAYAIRFCISNAKNVGRGSARLAVYLSGEFAELFGLEGRRLIPFVNRKDGLIAFQVTDSEEGFKLTKNNTTSMLQFQIGMRVDELGYWVGADKSRTIEFDDVREDGGLIVFQSARNEINGFKRVLQPVAARRTVPAQ